MYIDKIIKKEVVTLIISVGLLLIVFIGVSFASFFKIDEGKENVVETGDLAISFCSDSTCDTTYENIGQVIGTTKQNGTSVPSSIYPYPNDGTYSNATPYIFKVTNTGTMKATITIKLKEDTDFLPSGNYSEYSRLTSLYSDHLKVAIRKMVLVNNSFYQMGDANLDGIVNQKDAALILRAAAELETLTSTQTLLADINKDGNVNAIDAGIITQMLSGNDTVLEKMNIYSYSSLSNNIIYSNEEISPKTAKIFYIWLYMDETTPNQAQKTYFVGKLDVRGEYLPTNIKSFNNSSWQEIVETVKAGNANIYNVGDTKEVDLGDLGTHTLRISNKSTPDECATDGFSQSACGFVLEFADVISSQAMNSSDSNVGGWPKSTMYTYLNTTIYNALPAELRNGIIDTKTVSGYGSGDTAVITSTDKIYPLATAEIWNQGTSNTIGRDNARNKTRQLDYYKEKNSNTNNYSSAIKKLNATAAKWWLRSSASSSNSSYYYVNNDGDWNNVSAAILYGASPAFRIG